MAGRGAITVAGRPGLRVFVATWLLATLLLLVPLARGQRTFDLGATWPGLLALLACTIALVRWLPLPAVPGETTPRLRFAATLGLTCLAFFGTSALIGKLLIFAMPVLMLAVLTAVRPTLDRGLVLYVLGLGLVAAVAGLGSGWISFSPAAWGATQLPLVALGLPAGWALLARAGLLAPGFGASLYLARGAGPALRGFAVGTLLSLPWALANVVLGGANGDTWANALWSPLVAIQPGIAEEAWARVFLVSLAFTGLRALGRGSTRTALTWAVLVVGYWFAFLHTQGGLQGVPSALLIGTLYSLPLSFLWLGRELETAIGFHFAVDCLRYLAAYLSNAGIWTG